MAKLSKYEVLHNVLMNIKSANISTYIFAYMLLYQELCLFQGTCFILVTNLF